MSLDLENHKSGANSEEVKKYEVHHYIENLNYLTVEKEKKPNPFFGFEIHCRTLASSFIKT